MNEEQRKEEMIKIVSQVSTVFDQYDCVFVLNTLAFMIVGVLHQSCNTTSEANDLLKELSDGIMDNVIRNSKDGILYKPTAMMLQ